MLNRFLDHFPQVEKGWVHPSAVVIGQVILGEDSSVWPCVSIRGDVGSIKIGDRSNIQDGSVVHVTHKSNYNPDGFSVEIGNDVTIGHNVILHGCSIGNRVLVGMGTTVLDGAVLDEDIIIGANSLVPMNKKLESGYLYLGSPVKKVRQLTISEKKFLSYSAKNYVNLMKQYQASL